jgi:oxygen-independent coproporphyrinogen-3 oxidase
MGASFPPPRAAYLHVPFCIHRCGYCNFSVVAGRDDLVDSYLQAIAKELSWLGQPCEVDTLYFGGGTPTYLPAAQLQQLCDTVLTWHPLAEGYEWTVEANPGDLDEDRIRVLAEAGVNRLSLGAQSFRDSKLKLLERDHQADDIYKAVNLARQAVMSISLDLIFAAPGETLAQWQDDLDKAIRLRPDHISTYGLNYERGTTFWNRRNRGELASVAEELERDMYVSAIERLQGIGYEHYEISNFAKPGCRSRHNETYWSGDGYYAAGPGAARYVNGFRETNHGSTSAYLKRVLAGNSPVAERESLDQEQRAREYLVFGLRRLEGVTRQRFIQRTGLCLDDLAGAEISRFVEAGMLADDGESLSLTRQGLLISDALWPDFL